GDKTRGEGAGILQNTYLDGRDDYFAFQGTSMASPHVAAVATLVSSLGVKDPAEVKAILQKSAQSRGPREKYGAGELNAEGAVKLAKAASGDYYGRLWLIAGLWGFALVAGAMRRGRVPWQAALAVTLGLW